MVAFLVTDVGGSTRLWAANPKGAVTRLKRHSELVRKAMESRKGFMSTTGGQRAAGQARDLLAGE
jgi:class 3 adenylate cyclase